MVLLAQYLDTHLTLLRLRCKLKVSTWVDQMDIYVLVKPSIVTKVACEVSTEEEFQRFSHYQCLRLRRLQYLNHFIQHGNTTK